MSTPDQLYARAMALLVEWYGPNMATAGGCLYINQVTMKALKDDGRRAVLQAGSVYWPMRRDALGPVHFGYEFDLSQPFSVEAVQNGLLPEVHIWAALPDEGAIVDFSTGAFKRLAVERHGLEWEEAEPLRYVWGRPPAGVIYRPQLEAIRYVWRFIAEKMGEGVVA